MRCSALTIILSFLFISNSFSQIEFGDHVEISQSTTGYIELKHFDFDNDGFDDLLCSSTKNDRVVWYRNTNAIGEVVLERSKLSGNAITINRGNLLSGIYFLTITQNYSVNLGAFKVIVE